MMPLAPYATAEYLQQETRPASRVMIQSSQNRSQKRGGQFCTVTVRSRRGLLHVRLEACQRLAVEIRHVTAIANPNQRPVCQPCRITQHYYVSV
jgi:hypothetical protein